jgi:hypothetical protein
VAVRRFAVGALALIAAMGVLAACTKSTSTTIIHSTVTTTPSPQPTARLSTGPTTSATVTKCPFLDTQTAADNAGMRLDKITEQHSGGKVVGCRIYPLEHPNEQCDQTCLSAEDLPPGQQPAVEIETSSYPSATAAHNAFITIAEAGTSIQRDLVATDNTGLCYQTDFWSHDKGKDWACTFSKGTTVVVIRTVVTDPALNVVEIAKVVEPKL